MSRKGFPAFFLPKNEMEDYYMRDYTNFERCNGEPCCVFAERICADNYKELLAACIRYGTSIIIDSDAHCEADVGNHSLAHAFLEEMHFPEELIVNTSLGKAAAFIPKLKQLLSENEAFRASAERNTAL